MKAQEEGVMSGNEKGEPDEQKTVVPITYQSSLTLRVATPTVAGGAQWSWARTERQG
jgi:hypothetical protein